MPSQATPHVHPFVGVDLAHLLALRGRQRSAHPFLVWSPFDSDERSWTYAEFADAVARLAAAMARRGVRRGDRVLIHLENCPEGLLSWFACAHLGAVAVSTNARAAGKELAYFAEHSGAVAAITQPRLATTGIEHCKGLSWIAVTEDDNGAPPEWGRAPDYDSSFVALMTESERAPLRPTEPLLPLAIQYTSGTTSRPKGVVMTHANGLWGGKIGAAHEGLRPDDIFFIHLPLYHVIALSYSLLATLWAGGTAVLAPRFSASRFWSQSLRHRCTWTSMVPFCVRALAVRDVPASHHYRTWGNAFWSSELEQRYGVAILGWWGMTEIITQGIVGELDHPGHPMAIGRPAPEYEFAVQHDDGTPVDHGETGHLLIRGTPGVSLFAEYLDNRAATADSFDERGFFKTGDRVTVHADGFIQFADRAKDMLKVGGENVAASEIERVILRVAAVREVAVVGKQHPMLGEVPVAFVTLAGTARERQGLVDEIAAACRAELASFKVPEQVCLIEDMPRGAVEKISKVKLRDHVNGVAELSSLRLVRRTTDS